MAIGSEVFGSCDGHINVSVMFKNVDSVVLVEIFEI